MKTSLKLSLLAGFNLLATFGFNALVLLEEGPSGKADAFFASLIIPQFITSIIGTLVNAVFVPMLAGKDHLTLSKCGTLLRCALAIHAPLTLALISFASHWVPVIIPGFEQERLDLTVSLSRVQSVSILFLGLASVFTATMQAQNRFALVEAAFLLPNWAALLLLAPILRHGGIEGASYLMVGRSALSAALLATCMRWRIWHPYNADFARQVFRRSYPLLLGAIYYKTATIANGVLASMAPQGHLSTLHIAERTCAAVNEILRRSVAVPAVAALANAFKAGNTIQFRQLYWTRLLTVSALSTAFYVAVLGTALLAQPHLSSPQDRQDLVMGTHTFASLGGYLVGGAAGLVLAGAWHARGMSKTTAFVGAAAFTVGLALRFVLGIVWGVPGIGLSISIHYALACCTYLVLEFRWQNSHRPGEGPTVPCSRIDDV